MVLIIIVIICFFIWEISSPTYRANGHIKYIPGTLKKGVSIIDVDTKRVGSKSSSRYRTTFTFEDGFKYITYKTRVEHNLFATYISLSKKDIMELASFACQLHEKAAASDSPDSTKEIDIPIPEPLFSDEKASAQSSFASDTADSDDGEDEKDESIGKFPTRFVVVIGIIAIVITILSNI